MSIADDPAPNLNLVFRMSVQHAMYLHIEQKSQLTDL